jgi:glutathione peroxidase
MNYILLALTLWGLPMLSTAAETTPCAPALDFTFRPLAGGEPVHLCKSYQGKVVVIVNTASKCGYTRQYAGLEALYKKYKDRGLVVLGFPSNDFGQQEPGTEAEIKDFCRLTYGVEFPMFEKVRVVAPDTSPLYLSLHDLTGTAPQWNFHKYLLGRDGRPIGSYKSAVEPDAETFVNAIETALTQTP